MSNFVVLAQRTAGQALVATSPTTAQNNDARRMSLAQYENRARGLNAIDVSPSATHRRGIPNQYLVPATHQSGTVDFPDTSVFLAQNADSDQTIGARMPAAIAAYTKARDSRIEFQSSFQALDIRV